jgi:hypothetical protein
MQRTWLQPLRSCQYRALQQAHIARDACMRSLIHIPIFRAFSISRSAKQDAAPLRKELKDGRKATRAAKGKVSGSQGDDDKDAIPGWELTVGIEVHAQLNTARKLFSGKSTCSHKLKRCLT